MDITPPIGIAMCGYLARDGVSRWIERPLTATCLVLASGSDKIAIIGCDVMGVFEPDASEIRRRVAAAIGTRAECVLVNASHTHCGPSMRLGYSWEPPQQRAMQDTYALQLRDLVTGCAAAANARLQPARLVAGAGESHIGINRREVDPESGKVFLGENPDGPMDPSVGVIRVDDLGGRPLAIVFSYGCHTVTMGPKFLGLSPDFPGPARELVEHATGALSIFLQAAGGNINPVTGIGATEDDSADMMRLGQRLGAAVVETAMTLRTDKRRGERVIFQSLTRNSMYPWVAMKDRGIRLGGVSETVALPLVDPPGVEGARAIMVQRTKMLEDARREGRPENQLAFFYRFADWARYLLREVESGKRSLTMDAQLQALRIGDLGIAAVSGETLVELGLRTKQASPFEQTLFLGYSNGNIGYIPAAEHYPAEGWSAWETYLVPDMLCQSYMLPMHLAPTAGGIVVERCVELLGRSVPDAVP
ncbi:MAG: hypothetical protein U0Q16_21735 [Bryobacteraceae bacterium]